MGDYFLSVLQLVDSGERAVLLADEAKEVVIGAEHHLLSEGEVEGLDGADRVLAVDLLLLQRNEGGRQGQQQRQGKEAQGNHCYGLL